jgi:iron complex outermembrane receptor protein
MVITRSTTMLEAYTQFMFMDYQSNAQIAPSGNFFATTRVFPVTTRCCRQTKWLAFVPSIWFRTDDPDTAVTKSLTLSPASKMRLLVRPGDATLGMQNAITGSAPGRRRRFACSDPVRRPAYFGRRNIEGGGRTDNLGYQTYRGVAGLRGDLYKAPGWSYDVSASFAQVTLSSFVHGTNSP